jgi:hypothetical protein|tara:strand:- start:1735 stop:1890 length:156 start_codon:yes stop_codon:yes gene_type:complete
MLGTGRMGKGMVKEHTLLVCLETFTSMLGNGRMVKCGMEYITTKTEKSNTR